MRVNLINNQTGKVKDRVKVGFSWTVFFFGFLSPLFRGEILWALISFILMFTFIGNIIMAVLYNGVYIRKLIGKGFTPSDQESELVLVNRGFLAPRHN